MTTIYIPQTISADVVAEIRNLMKMVELKERVHLEVDDNISVAHISKTTEAYLSLLQRIRDVINSRTYFMES